MPQISQLGSVGYELESHDCTDLWDRGLPSGVYSVTPLDGGEPISVFCEMTADSGWLIIQRRVDGSENFTKNWDTYKAGFGDLTNEFWLGNTNIHRLTSQKTHELMVDLGRFNGEIRHAAYSSFSVGSESDKFRLHVSGYSGNAGDSFSYHNNRFFSTNDHDNDGYPNWNCAMNTMGGWWFRACHKSNLNGIWYNSETRSTYGLGIVWFDHWINAYSSLKTSVIKIRPVNDTLLP
ncbi:fibrinogen-like protein 1 [Gigantopelta aegis]|uniref:fibrinogen-like protein 1 n=1 Tax=Gigantopelta aegis TaxID=1735272 RepID=UPI001B888AF2|nr:fibrinogen-like protein 1 [Gigantopelta aegis]